MAVRIIPAQPSVEGTTALQPERTLRVAAYTRVSTEMDEQESSYEAQCTHYEKYITDHDGWVLAGIYADKGLSATSTKKREQFNKMIEDCENGLVDMVLTKSISRFARNTLDCLENVRKLKALGIPIIFEKENINTMGASGELFLTIMASLAQQESASISQNTRMGWQYNFQQGRPMLNHSRFLGFTKQRGDMKLTIVPEEAELVRSIFRWKLEGMSVGEIGFNLEERGIIAPGGKKRWHYSTVISMLQNEKYMGDLLLQKSYSEDFLSKKRMKNEGVLPQYYVENAHEPIVPKEVFYRVQGELGKRQGKVGNPGNIRRTAFSGKVYSGDDAYRRFLGTKRYPNVIWRCKNKGSGRGVKEQELEEAVNKAFNRLPEYHLDLARMEERILWGPMDRISREIDDANERIRNLENTLSDYAASGTLDRKLICLYGDGSEDTEVAIDGIKAEMDSLNATKADLLMQKGEVAIQEAQVHSLLRVICAVTGRKVEQPEPDSPACYSLSDFYDRTDDLRICGKVEEFDKQLVRRFIERIEVEPDRFVVIFKAGISIPV